MRSLVYQEEMGFNPCCAGTGYPAPLPRECRSPGWGFQSLLCWNWLPGGVMWNGARPRRDVSILVVLELATRQVFAALEAWRRKEFQSLLCWNWLPGPAGPRALRHGGRVSILVVLELATRLQVWRRYENTGRAFQSLLCWNWLPGQAAPRPAAGLEPRFNPCCAGTGYPASTPRRKWPSGPSFNPCCAGTGYPAASRRGPPPRLILFQSLLCWNWLPGGSAPAAAGGGSQVSILVVLELATRPRRSQGRSLRRNRFNPCCAGTGYPAREVEKEIHNRFQFQSLLCWNWLPGGMRGECGRWPSWVSILVVLELATRRPGWCSIMTGVSGFNPCCAGTGYPARGTGCLRAECDAVSILVVLELATRQCQQTEAPYLPGVVSILVVLELATRQQLPVHAWVEAPEVSILVVLELATRRERTAGTPAPPRGFNPCCAGTGYPAPGGGRRFGAVAGFQSLLCWNWLPGRARRHRGLPGCGVSILVVLELATRPHFSCNLRYCQDFHSHLINDFGRIELLRQVAFEVKSRLPRKLRVC